MCVLHHPDAAGRYRSRPADSILREAGRSPPAACKELLLISQDTSFYGIDRGERGALARLLRELNAVEGLEWIRLLYLYPTTMTDDVLDAMAECEQVCNTSTCRCSTHRPRSSSACGVPATARHTTRCSTRIRARVPGVTLRTTFIVGFPGETEADFDELAALSRDTRFDHVGVFTYSHEEGTRAFAMEDDVPAAGNARAGTQLMGLQKQIVTAAQKARDRRDVHVLVDGPSPDSRSSFRAGSRARRRTSTRSSF